MKFIFCLLLASVYVAQGHSSFWDDELMDDVLDPSGIAESISENIRKMNEKIQKDIKSHRENANAMRTRIENEAKSGGTYTSSSTSSSSSLVNGVSVSEVSGTNTNGEKYYRKTEEKNDNGVLYRTETVRNPTTGKTTVYQYTQDLNNPNAEAVLVKQTESED